MGSASTLNLDEILNNIHNEKIIKDELGNDVILKDNIDREEGMLLERLISVNGLSRSIEVGCAYGISSLYICGAVTKHHGHHTIVDPFQTTDWNNIGITQLRNAGFENFTLLEERSEIALPKLVEQGAKFDFAFIDGWHTFDHTLLDMYYMNRLLCVGGIMVIDDVGMTGVEKAVNYFLNYPSYKFLDGIKVSEVTKERQFFMNFIISPLRIAAKLLPKKISEEIFSDKVSGSGISGYSMVALKKIKEDERPWNWYHNF
ncbi:class I SAM-dependent methyltransferase [Pontibacter populi]|uniref:Class I SAM-dependent methyltransferase n=1 Tax=Pontibacter populi TaxID=890055 RepID=A0ABV1RVA1_9BACT